MFDTGVSLSTVGISVMKTTPNLKKKNKTEQNRTNKQTKQNQIKKETKNEQFTCCHKFGHVRCNLCQRTQCVP